MVGAGDNFPTPQKLMNGMRKIGAELETFFREDAERESTWGNIPVDEDVGRAPSGGAQSL